MTTADKSSTQAVEEKDKADVFADSIVNFVEDLFKAQKVSLDEFAAKSSKEIDKIIIKKTKDGSEFIAGRFSLIFVSAVNFKFAFEFYIKSPAEKDYTKVYGESKPISTSRLKEDSLTELMTSKEVAYEIDEPVFGKISKVSDNNSNPDSVS